jgi:hypothetical protein
MTQLYIYLQLKLSHSTKEEKSATNFILFWTKTSLEIHNYPGTVCSSPAGTSITSTTGSKAVPKPRSPSSRRNLEETLNFVSFLDWLLGKT